MSRTVRSFEYSDANLFEVCDAWATKHAYKTIESSESHRLYSRRQPILAPLSLLLPARYKVAIDRSSDVVTVACWIAFFSSETEVSSESIYGFLGKEIVRAQLDDLLTQLGEGDKLVH